MTRQVGPGKAVLELPHQATLTVAAGVIPTPTPVTFRTVATAGRTGAVGPAYEVDWPAGISVRGVPRIDIMFTPDPGIPADLVKLAYLQRELGGAPLMWITIPDSSYDPASKVLSGPVSRPDLPPPVQYAPVRSCLVQSPCGPNDSCLGGACQ